MQNRKLYYKQEEEEEEEEEKLRSGKYETRYVKDETSEILKVIETGTIGYIVSSFLYNKMINKVIIINIISISISFIVWLGNYYRQLAQDLKYIRKTN